MSAGQDNPRSDSARHDGAKGVQPKLQKLLKKLRSRFAEKKLAAPEVVQSPEDGQSLPPRATHPLLAPFDHEAFEPFVGELVYSILLWNNSTAGAAETFARLTDSFVDLNELRVSLAAEVAESLGEHDGLNQERALRLLASLNDIFERFHAVSLANLGNLSKRDAEHLLNNIEGCPHFAANRVAAVRLHAHVLPVDERMVALFAAEGLCEADESVTAIAGRFARALAGEEMFEAVVLLRKWSDADGKAPTPTAVEMVVDTAALVLPAPESVLKPVPTSASTPDKPSKSKSTSKATTTQAAAKTEPALAKKASSKLATKPSKSTPAAKKPSSRGKT